MSKIGKFYKALMLSPIYDPGLISIAVVVAHFFTGFQPDSIDLIIFAWICYERLRLKNRVLVFPSDD